MLQTTNDKQTKQTKTILYQNETEPPRVYKQHIPTYQLPVSQLAGNL